MFCKIDGCGRPIENHELGLCSSHARSARKELDKPQLPVGKYSKIKFASDKQMKKINEYVKVKKEFLIKNKICAVCGNPGADSIHHSKGKVGYADNDARLKDIPLLLDTRFFVPIHSFNLNKKFGCSCHRYIEDHPEYARNLGFTKSRLSDD